MQEANHYDALKSVLDKAFEQASEGKGKERHGNNLAFEDQPMQVICDLLGSNHFCIGQAIKKAQESTRMENEKAKNELLGAIVYLAGAVIALGDTPKKSTQETPEHRLVFFSRENLLKSLPNIRDIYKNMRHSQVRLRVHHGQSEHMFYMHLSDDTCVDDMTNLITAHFGR